MFALGREFRGVENYQVVLFAGFDPRREVLSNIGRAEGQTLGEAVVFCLEKSLLEECVGAVDSYHRFGSASDRTEREGS